MPSFLRRVIINSRLSIFVIFSPSINTSPAVGSIKRLTNLIRVDLPLPDKPIITNISPCSTEKDVWLTPTVIPVFLNISSFFSPFFKRFNPSSGLLPNIFVIFFTSILPINNSLLKNVNFFLFLSMNLFILSVCQVLLFSITLLILTKSGTLYKLYIPLFMYVLYVQFILYLIIKRKS